MSARRRQLARYVRFRDVLHGEPSVQKRAAPASEREGDVLHVARRSSILGGATGL